MTAADNEWSAINRLKGQIEKLGPSEHDRATLRHIDASYDKGAEVIAALGRLRTRMETDRKTVVRMDQQPEAIAR